MGAKLYADTTTKTLIITQAPDVNGFINLNAREEVWSDLIIDWEGDVDLRKFTFPVVAIGGQTISAGKLGTTYVLLSPWQIAPYEADQDFNIDGNLFTESALTKLVLPTVGPYTVTVSRNLSTLVEVVETGGSGLTPEESQALIDIANLQALIQTDIGTINTNVATQLSLLTGIEERDIAEHITNPESGKLEIVNDTAQRRWVADAWEDLGKNIPYKGTGLEVIGVITEITY